MENKKIPEIRFSGFIDEWLQLKFIEILKNRDGIRRGPFGSALKKDLFVKSSDYVVYEQKNAIYNNFDTRYNITEEKFKELKNFQLGEGDFILSGAGTIGRISRVPKNIKPGVFNQALIRFRINEAFTDSEYFLQWIRSEKMQKEITGANPGSAITNLVPMSEVKNWNIIIPTINEQAKIGVFFKKLDDIIAIHQQELDTLKQTKQGFLQKMFPKEGVDMPEVRFAGFSGEWRITPLSKILSIPEKNIVLEPEREKLLTVKLHCNGIHQNKNTATLQIGSTNYYKRKSGQFIYGKQNFFNGAFGIIPDQYDGYLTSSDIPALEINYEKVSSSYLLYFMSRKNFYKKTESISSGTGSKRIHESTLLKIEIPIPPLEEQNQIGNFFKQLDEVIALHQQELEALKQTKKAFLQKMFV